MQKTKKKNENKLNKIQRIEYDNDESMKIQQLKDLKRIAEIEKKNVMDNVHWYLKQYKNKIISFDF